MKVRAIDFVVLKVSDMQRSETFYRETLGIDVPLSGDSESGIWKELDTPPVALALFKDAKDPGGNALVALAVEDVAAAVEELRGKGVKVLMDPFESPVCHQAVIEDPDGNVLLLHQRKDGSAG